MKAGTDFDDLWNQWQDGCITYMQFAKRIQLLGDVPDDVKEVHLESANMVREEINKALHVYFTMQSQAPEAFKRIMNEYDPEMRYNFVAGVTCNGQNDQKDKSTLH